MPFRLVIRHNIEQTADDFQKGDVRLFEGTPAGVGSDPGCECPLPPEYGVPAACFVIDDGRDLHGFTVRPAAGVPVFLNQQPVPPEGTVLHSGDEIRVEHVTCRFQKTYRAVGQGRRADLLAVFAKGLILAILIGELSLVYWLPRKLQSEHLLADQILRQETMLLLDQLRYDARLDGEQETNPAAVAARRLITRELDHMAQFLRARERDLTRQQWQQFGTDMKALGHHLEQLRHNTWTPPLPELELEATVQGLLSREESGPTP